MQHKGVIAQVLGPVVDVQFDEGSLPQINEELVVEKNKPKSFFCIHSLYLFMLQRYGFLLCVWRICPIFGAKI